MRINNFIEIEFSIQRPVPCHGAFFFLRPAWAINCFNDSKIFFLRGHPSFVDKKMY